MEITIATKTTAQEMFEVMRDSIIQDLHTHADLKAPGQLLKKGMTFSKRLRNGQKAQSEILAYEENRIISIQYKTDKLRSLLVYRFAQGHDNACVLTFESANYRLSGKEIKSTWLTRYRMGRSMKKRIRLVEHYVLQNRVNKEK